MFVAVLDIKQIYIVQDTKEKAGKIDASWTHE